MTEHIPTWVQIFQALLTPVIAMAVAVIGVFQWRISHDKVILDLFQHRIKIFHAVDTAIYEFVTAQRDDVYPRATNKVEAAQAEARFLFGDEVTTSIRDLLKKMRKYAEHNRLKDASGIPAHHLTQRVDEMIEIESDISDWRIAFAELCSPYMRMDQKRIRGAKQKLSHLNAKRLSYADQEAPSDE